jgi:ABC-type Zn uptake system ZnuABC Zn-binding protein ZnuA
MPRRIPQKQSGRNPLRGCAPLFLFLFLLSKIARAEVSPIPVVATLPVLKDFVQQIGGSHVVVKSLVTGMESEHTYTPKPSDIISVGQARMLVKVGLGLEVWVNGLIRNAENGNLLTVNTSEGIALIKDTGEDHDDHPGEAPGDESFKERHSMGNPHIWLDPENAKVMVRHITDGLVRLDPASKGEYLRRQSDYFRAMEKLEKEIKKRVRALPDRRIITQHPAWPYFARRFGFVIDDNIIDQVGTESSAKHLQALIRKIHRKKIKVVVSEPQLNPQVPLILRQETGIKVVVLSPLPGAIPGTETYLELIRYNADQLISALGGTP